MGWCCGRPWGLSPAAATCGLTHGSPELQGGEGGAARRQKGSATPGMASLCPLPWPRLGERGLDAHLGGQGISSHLSPPLSFLPPVPLGPWRSPFLNAPMDRELTAPHSHHCTAAAPSVLPVETSTPWSQFCPIKRVTRSSQPSPVAAPTLCVPPDSSQFSQKPRKGLTGVWCDMGQAQGGVSPPQPPCGSALSTL